MLTNNFCKRLYKPFAFLILFFVLINIVSCKSIIIHLLIKNPVVESNNSIMTFIQKNKGNLENNYVIDFNNKNEDEMFNFFIKGLESKILIFNNDSILINNNTSEHCQTKNLTNFLNNKISFTQQKDKKLKDYISNLKQISKLDEFKWEYITIMYWSKATGKRGYEDLLFLENKIKNSGKDIKILKINTDFNKDWGLKEGAVIHYKIKNDEMIFDNLPYENIKKSSANS